MFQPCAGSKDQICVFTALPEAGGIFLGNWEGSDGAFEGKNNSFR